MRPELASRLCVFAWAIAGTGAAQDDRFVVTGQVEPILSEWDQAKIMERQLRWRQANVVPEVMRREGVDLWLVSRREGVLYRSLVPADDEGLVAEQPAVLVFHDRGPDRGVERSAVRSNQLARIVGELNPRAIALAEETRASLGDGLAERYRDRLVSSGPLRTGFLEKRSPEEMSLFHHVARVAHEIIAEAFSNKAVTPDVTTTDELNWWIRQRYIELGLPTSDHPTITVQRSRLERPKYEEGDEHFRIDIPPRNGYDTVIRRGDILACDTGINYLGLGTDTQQVAYVLKEGETDAPPGLRQAIANSVRLQDIFAAEFRDGRIANEIVAAAYDNARAEGLRPEIYGHPIPYFLKRYSLNGAFFANTRYGAGPALGYEGSEGPSERGNYPVYANTAYAMELDTETSVREWDGQDVRIVLEQTIAFTGGRVVFLGGRQKEFYLIR